MMLHARVDTPYCHHALLHACYIYSILPVRGLHDSTDNPTTPYYLFHGHKPNISSLKTLFCPVIYKSTQSDLQQGIRGVHIGFAHNQSGYQIYVPSTRQIVVSLDVMFDEEFRTAVGLTNRAFHNSIYLRHIHLLIVPWNKNMNLQVIYDIFIIELLLKRRRKK